MLPQYSHLYQQCSINSKLSYPLLALFLPDKQLYFIQKIVHPSVIVAKRFNRNWPILLKFWKHKYCGLEMLDLKVKQRLRKIQFIKKLFLHKRHKIIIQSITKQYQLTTGVEELILAKPNNKINYTSSVCFQDIVAFRHNNNITIFIKDYFNITSQRINDKCVMEETLQLNLSQTSLIK